MENVTKDLWSEDIGVAEVSQRTPVAILRQQAAYLGDKTQNIVKAEVSTSPRSSPLLDLSSLYDFTHTFTLVAPILENYKYDLFIVMHNLGLYPLVLQYAHQNYDAGTEAEFIRQLQKVLSSPRTKEIIQQLIAMSEK